ncbi:MAG TPA: bifunctional glutamate N-acetyltransferase/amino-acid acetyltransferase ArgJ [Roseiflexaceae bacterium]|nr:bifunctional glutamate N-acetyltransferase/amino-acid acetyltransferase ArgJ [Roseiflexaceae bacterium]
MTYRLLDDGHISSPKGFRATGISCGLKEARARDLALVYSQKPCRAAALFTTSALPAAPVFFDQAVLARSRENVRAVLINAGHANAGTGPQGLADAVECAKLAADELEVPRDSVLLMSTGQIGVSLPMRNMKDGIRRAVSELDSGGGRRAALAMLTTDTRPKDRALSFLLRDGRSISVAGMAKGSRMVHPRLATLLCVVTTDLTIDAHLLHRSLEHSVSQTFGRLSLDGDTSPNDTVVVLANGAAEAPLVVDANAWEFGAWQEALDALCADLAQQVARDAAGNGKLIQIHVRGAVEPATADQAARAIARSAAVRWGCANASADWGGLLAAIGASGIDLRPDLLELRVGATPVLVDGAAVAFDPRTVIQTLSNPEIELVVDLHMGNHTTTIWTCTAAVEY